MKNQIGIQVMDLNPIKTKKALKEIRARKGKTAFKKMLEKNKLATIFGGHDIRLGGSLVDYLLA